MGVPWSTYILNLLTIIPWFIFQFPFHAFLVSSKLGNPMVALKKLAAKPAKALTKKTALSMACRESPKSK